MAKNKNKGKKIKTFTMRFLANIPIFARSVVQKANVTALAAMSK